MVTTTLDSRGRRVVLDEEAWDHIKHGHAVLASRLHEIMAVVREPTEHSAGREPGEEWFFADEPLAPLWLKVVVHYEGDEGWIVTAFPVGPRRRR